MRLREGEQNLADFFRIGGRRDGERDHQPACPIVAHKIGNDAGDEARVWDDHLGPVKGLDFRRADIDAADKTLVGADDDPIANPDGALPQKDQTRDEIIDDRLKAKTDTDRQGARDKGKLFEIQPEIAERDASRDEKAKIAEAGPDRIAQTEIEVHPWKQFGI